MEPEHIIDEQATIKKADIEKVYDDCISWLNNRKSILRYEYVWILDQDRPFTIIANHQKSADEWAIERKSITITLKEGEEGVSVRLVMDSRRSDSLFDKSLTSCYWGYLVENFWEALEVEADLQMLQRLYPEKYLRMMRSLERDMWIFKYVAYFLVSCIFISVIVSEGRFLWYILAGLALALVPIHDDYRIKKRIDKLYPDRWMIENGA